MVQGYLRTIHDSFNKDGSQKDRRTKPFDSAKKPAWKKRSSGDSTQMDYLMEEMSKMTKLMKKLKKSKKHSKKCARDSSDSDSDSD